MQGGELEPTGVGAVAVVAEGQVGRPGSGTLLRLDAHAVCEVGAFGVDHLEHPSAEDLQRLRVVLPGQLHQVLLRLLDHMRARLVGERGEGLHDHAGLLEVHQPVRERVAGRRTRSVEGEGEAHVAVRGPAALVGGVRQPRSGRRGCRVRSDVSRVRRCQHPEPEPGQPGLGPGQLHQAVPLLVGGHRPGRRITDRVELRVHPRRAPGDGMRPALETRGRGHASNLGVGRATFRTVFRPVQNPPGRPAVDRFRRDAGVRA